MKKQIQSTAIRANLIRTHTNRFVIMVVIAALTVSSSGTVFFSSQASAQASPSACNTFKN